MKKALDLLLIIGSLIIFSFAYAQAPVATEIPTIEHWSEIPLSERPNPNQGSPFFIHWYRDQSGQEGVIMSCPRWPGDDPVPFLKSWGFTGDYPSYSFKNVHTALLADDGTWIVGTQGERVVISIGETSDDTKTIFVFTFNREHSSTSRTITFFHSPPPNQ